MGCLDTTLLMMADCLLPGDPHVSLHRLMLPWSPHLDSKSRRVVCHLVSSFFNTTNDGIPNISRCLFIATPAAAPTQLPTQPRKAKRAAERIDPSLRILQIEQTCRQSSCKISPRLFPSGDKRSSSRGCVSCLPGPPPRLVEPFPRWSGGVEEAHQKGKQGRLDPLLLLPF